MTKKILIMEAFSHIDTVHGHCENCKQETILVAIVTDYYRCTECGSDTRQHVNGSIRYLKLDAKDIKFIKKLSTEKDGKAKL